MKKLLIAIPIILLFLASGCITGQHSANENLPELNLTTGPAYEYNPTKYLPDWNLLIERPRIGQMPLDIQKELYEYDITDAATWEYQKGKENLYVWAKVYDTPKDAINASKGFASMFAFDQRTYLDFADQGSVGIYNTLNKSPPPLLLYIVQDNVLIHIAYFNNNGRYSDNNIEQDKYFLISLAKDMLGK